MDLWDVAKLMGRRWYVALPMLVLTVIGALYTMSAIKPDYVATTNVTLLPPSLRSDKPAGVEQKVNPWDTESLTVATLTYLNSKSLHDQLAAQGFSDVWAADVHIMFRSLIIIKVTASTPEQAQRTAQELQKRVNDEVQRQQAKYPLKAGEKITAQPFDNGDNLETASTKLKRALIVVLGVGVILTIAFTVGLDAFLRWRGNRRRAVSGQVVIPRQVGGPPGRGGQGKAVEVSVTPVGGRPSVEVEPPITIRMMTTTSSSGNGDTNATDETRALRPAATYQSGGRGDQPAPPAVRVEYAPVAVPERVPVHEDATIVLPLSNAPWASKGGKGDKNGEIKKR